jgi:membrane-associated phospholipid phosphatase
MEMNRQVRFVKAAVAATLISVAFSNTFIPTVHAASAQIEPGAGSWKTWVITSGAQLPLPAPPGAKETRKEIDELLSLQKQRSQTVMETLRYWDSGSPNYRWNQIAFRVANESSASVVTERMLALLNVAIYDAMIAAWHWKYKYHRQRPSQLETKLKTLALNSESPSYPSEHAVAAGAASAVLSYLFPDKTQFLTDKAEEAGRSRLLAGAQYSSDVTAGLQLGRQVATLVIERAKKDGSDAKWTGTVPTKPGLWNGTNPAIPEMATWKTWVLSSPGQLRPAPPSFDAAAMAEVKNAPNTGKARRAAYYWALTSLPQYWNELASLKMFENKLDGNPPRAARAYAILSTAYYDSLIACWDAKYAYWGIRPFQFDPEFKSLIPTPNFPGYPSGHATMSGAAASILAYLFPADSEYFHKQAEEAAMSRLWGGVHFRVDNEVGLALGRSVASLAIEHARKDGAERSDSARLFPGSSSP